MTTEMISHNDYSPSHPWYYYLGGERLSLNQIRAMARAGAEQYPFKLMAEEAIAADKLGEPKRSEELRKFKAKKEQELIRDISIYRRVVRELNHQRKHQPNKQAFTSCDDVNTSMSLKFAHLYNDFSQWDYVNELLNQQADLFGF